MSESTEGLAAQIEDRETSTPQEHDPQRFEAEKTVGAPRPKLIVGLGNPGEKYIHTRHNAGFKVIEEIARRRDWRLDRELCSTRCAGDDSLFLAQPQTYMNRSGYAVRCLAELRGYDPGDVLVVFDEVHLPLGRLRLRRRGSPGGHRGLESIIESLRSNEIPRLRLGVGPGEPAADDLVDLVLSDFDPDEQDAVETMTKRAADACELWLAEGTEAAMNRFNG